MATNPQQAENDKKMTKGLQAVKSSQENLGGMYKNISLSYLPTNIHHFLHS